MDGMDGGFVKKNRIMKKAVYNKYGTRQIIDSGWKEFDRQTNFLATGNVIANTQISSFIRPWCETECNGFTRREGELMKYDLNQFGKWHIPADLLVTIKDKNRKESVILYLFYTMTKDRYVKPFGWVLTTKDHRYINSRVIREWGESYVKRSAALSEAIRYITIDK